MSIYTDLIRQHIAYDPDAGTLTWKEDSELGRKGESAIVNVWVDGTHRQRVVMGCEVYEAIDVCWFLWSGYWPTRKVEFHDEESRTLDCGNLYHRTRGMAPRTEPEVMVPRDVLKQVYRALPDGDLRNAVVQAFLRNEGVERCP
jgi:hypothetical protein